MKLDRHYMKLFATGQIPDGYFGDYATVNFMFHIPSGKTIVDWKGKLFTYQTPPAQDINEAAWLLEHHPTSNARFVTFN